MNQSSRRAFSLIEMTIAAALLGVVFSVLGQFLSRWEAARRSADERAYALRTIENILERVAIRAADPTDLLADLHVADRLNAPQLNLTRGEPDDLGLIRITASLSWQNGQKQRVSPVTLTAWQLNVASPQEASQ
jgi:prepilin-type N-terminal cleavage/methylation domain-containing protein